MLVYQLCLNRTRAAFEFKKTKILFAFEIDILICPVSTAIYDFRHPCIINVWTIENI